MRIINRLIIFFSSFLVAAMFFVNREITVFFVAVALIYILLLFSRDIGKIIFSFYVLVVFFSCFVSSSFFSLMASNLPETIKNAFYYTDEVFILIFFPFIVLKELRVQNKILLACILLHAIVGFYSGFRQGAFYVTLLEGMCLTLKGPMLFVIMYNVKIEKESFIKFGKYCYYFFWIAAIFAIIDLSSKGAYETMFNLSDEKRFGIHSLHSVFSLQSESSWFFFTFALGSIVFKMKRGFLFFSCLFGFLSGRVKDIIAFVIVLFIDKKHNIFKILGVLVILVPLLFKAYSSIFPDHYKQYWGNIYDVSIARNALTLTSIDIGIENFPFGEGFGRFGGYVSYVKYSPVFEKYGISKVYGLSEEYGHFIADTFWPMILGESGFLGLLLYCLILFMIFGFLFKKYEEDFDAKIVWLAKAIFLMALITSIAQPMFVKPPQYLVIFGFTGLVASFVKDREKKPEKVSIPVD